MPDRDFELGQQIARLEGTLNAGFTAINSRLDVSNGRLAKHDKLIGDLYERDASSTGREQGKKAIWNLIVTVASLIIAALAIYFR